MVDRVQVIKWESPSSGGTDDDSVPSEINPNEDAIETRRVYLQNDTSEDETVYIDRDSSGNMVFKDVLSSSKTLSELASGIDDTMCLTAGRNSLVTNSYLRTAGNVPTNQVGLVVPINATLTGISVSTLGNATWNAKIFRNSDTSPICTLAISNLSKHYGAFTTLLNAGDELRFYCDGTAIDKPIITVWIKVR